MKLTVQLSEDWPVENDTEKILFNENRRFLFTLTSNGLQMKFKKSWTEIKNLNTQLRSLFPLLVSLDFGMLEGEGKKPSLFKGIKNLLLTNRQSNSMQEKMDKIAEYFQGLFMDPEIYSSGPMQQFLGYSHPSFDDKKNILLKKDEDAKRIQLNSFDIVRVIGRGCIGKVMLVKMRETRQFYALKCIHKSQVVQQKQEIRHILSERDILVRLTELNHPFLMQLHFSFQTQTDLYLVLDYYGGGDLATHLARCHRFPLDRARFYAAEMVVGIAELHSHGIIYRDLKPENVLLRNDGHIVLTDFGLSKQLLHCNSNNNDNNGTGVETVTFCGTAEYLAPEILLSLPYDFSVDWWSFGTLLYEMITGITPFWADDRSAMYQRILFDTLEFPCQFISGSARDLITGLLERDPGVRSGLEIVMNHGFFSTIDWNEAKALKLLPPFIPKISCIDDYSNFEEAFTQEPAIVTPTTPTTLPSTTLSSTALSMKSDPPESPFIGFSYDERRKFI